MSQIGQQVKLFLQSASIVETENIQNAIISFFNTSSENKHLIFKRSILYFYDKENVVNSIACTSSEDNVYTFDGVKVSRIKPEYYLGGTASSVSGTAMLDGLEVGYSNNNNNNNNNNNGNNNG